MRIAYIAAGDSSDSVDIDATIPITERESL